MGEVGSKAVASDILHLVLVRQRRDSALRVLFRELFEEKHEVCKASANLDDRFLERSKVGL